MKTPFFIITFILSITAFSQTQEVIANGSAAIPPPPPPTFDESVDTIPVMEDEPEILSIEDEPEILSIDDSIVFFADVEHKPIFPGCENLASDEDGLMSCFVQNLIHFIGEEFKYPEEARNIGIEGKIFVEFIIDESGNIGHMKILRSVDPHLDQEALRVVQKLPRMARPAYMNGKPARIKFVLPINARL